MPSRPSSLALVACALLAAFTVWITRQAKTLEQDLDSSSQKIVLLDKPAPDFHLTALDGRAFSLSDYRGKKKLLLVFWATWNNASHPEMLLMSSLYQNAHQADSPYDLLGVSLDDDPAAMKQFLAESKIPFPVVLDHNRALADSYQIRTIPTLLLIDPDGKVVYGDTGVNRGGTNELARRLGLRPSDFRMEMRMNGRGN